MKDFTLQQNLTWSPIYSRTPVTREIPVPLDKEEIICHLLVCIREAVHQCAIYIPGPQGESLVLCGAEGVGGYYIVHGKA